MRGADCNCSFQLSEGRRCCPRIPVMAQLMAVEELDDIFSVGDELDRPDTARYVIERNISLAGICMQFANIKADNEC